MSEFDKSVEDMLASILNGDDPIDVPAQAPEQVKETPEPELLSPADEIAESRREEALTEEDELPSIDDIIGMPEEADGYTHVTEDDPEPTAPAEEVTVSEQVDEISEDLKLAEIEPLDETEWSQAVKVESIKLPEFTSEELMEDLDIRNYGTLVSLSTLRWHAKVRDRSAALNAAHATGADEAAYEARKRLLVGADEKLKRVHTAIDAARTEHYRMTLPWSTIGVNDHGKRSGPRLLPNTLFFEYTQKMGKYKQEMLVALDEFVKAYPALIALAKKKLSTAFDFSEYPAPSEIRKYFDLSFDFMPIPTGKDFGDVTLRQAEKLAMNVNKKTRQMLENAMQDAWKRLNDDMEHAYNALSNPNAKFHYTLIDKMKDNASMLSHLNVTKDPRIEAIRSRIEKDLAKRDVKDIRKDDALRKHMASEAKAVLTMMQEYTNDSAK